MRKYVFLFVVVVLFLSGCIGNNNSVAWVENKWMFGTWKGPNENEVSLNENGTGKTKDIEFLFSIMDSNNLRIFVTENSRIQRYDATFYRINDKQVVIRSDAIGPGLLIFNKN